MRTGTGTEKETGTKTTQTFGGSLLTLNVIVGLEAFLGMKETTMQNAIRKEIEKEVWRKLLES